MGYVPTVARYSRKEAEKLVRELKRLPKLSIQRTKPPDIEFNLFS